MRLLAPTLPAPQGHWVEVFERCSSSLKGLYGLSALHNSVRVDEMNSKAFFRPADLFARS